MINLGIIGFGNIGRVHAVNLSTIRGCRVVGVYDIRSEALLEASAGLRRYASASELIADSNVQAVIIATPTDSHRNVALAALNAGKHIFVEKPLAGTLLDAEAIVDAASGTSLCAQAGFCERFNPQYLEAKRTIDSGMIGTVRAIQSSRVAPYSLGNVKWELGILDTAVHNLDLILWLSRSKPVSVQCFAAQIYPDALSFHSATTIIRFENGALATDHIAWLRDDRHPLHECARSSMRIIGTQGVFEVDLTARPASLMTEQIYRQIDTIIIGGPDYYSCLKLQFEAFLRSIEEHQPVLAPLPDALLAERVVIAAAQSAKTGSEVSLV